MGGGIKSPAGSETALRTSGTNPDQCVHSFFSFFLLFSPFFITFTAENIQFKCMPFSSALTHQVQRACSTQTIKTSHVSLICDQPVLFPAGHLEPLTLFDHGGIHISLHFAKDSAAPSRPDAAAVVVVSTVNTSGLPVSDYTFQAAVPKVRRLKRIRSDNVLFLTPD